MMLMNKLLVEKDLIVKNNRFIPYGTPSCGEDPGRNTFETMKRFYSTPTELCCQWCTEPINAIPIPLAMDVNICNEAHDEVMGSIREWKRTWWTNRKKKGKPGWAEKQEKEKLERAAKNYWQTWFLVKGQYCSASCVLAASRSGTNGAGAKRMVSATDKMLREVYGIQAASDVNYRSHITGKVLPRAAPAPPREMLQKFGGPLTIEAFRATGGLCIFQKPIQLPYIPFVCGVEEIEHTRVTFHEILDEEAIQNRIERICFGRENLKYNKRKSTNTLPIYNRGPAMYSKGKRSKALRTAWTSSRKIKPFNHTNDKPPRSTTNHAKSRTTTSSSSSSSSSKNSNNPANKTSLLDKEQEYEYPTLEDQLKDSSKRLRLQRTELSRTVRKKPKKRTLLDYMTVN
jgi:hypothetical protein